MKGEHITAKQAREFIVSNADIKSRLVTDKARMYPRIGKEFTSHETVNHSGKEYARGR